MAAAPFKDRGGEKEKKEEGQTHFSRVEAERSYLEGYGEEKKYLHRAFFCCHLSQTAPRKPWQHMLEVEQEGVHNDGVITKEMEKWKQPPELRLLTHLHQPQQRPGGRSASSTGCIVHKTSSGWGGGAFFSAGQNGPIRSLHYWRSPTAECLIGWHKKWLVGFQNGCPGFQPTSEFHQLRQNGNITL